MNTPIELFITFFIFTAATGVYFFCDIILFPFISTKYFLWRGYRILKRAAKKHDGEEREKLMKIAEMFKEGFKNEKL
jgi:hypothetical protein